MRKKYFLRGKIRIFFLLLLNNAIAQVQENYYHFDHFTANDGLCSNEVTCITQDDLGFMWFGTNNGLALYDGYDFQIFQHDPHDKSSLSGSAIYYGNSITEDKYGNLWIGTWSGLNKLNIFTRQIERIVYDSLKINSTENNLIFCICPTQDENIWIGTPNGLFKYEADTKLYSRVGFSKVPSKSLTTQDINSLYVDNDNNLWIVTWLGGLNKFDQKSGTFESYTQKDGLRSHSVQGILGDEENSALWLSTFDGISRFDLKKKIFSNFGVDDGIHANQFAENSALKTSNGLMG